MLPSQIREFFRAAISPFSYNPKQNLYIWFGILWGLPIPLVNLWYEYRFVDQAGTSIQDQFHSPLFWFFLFHPLMFGAIFGILGTIRQEKEQKLEQTIAQLRDMTVHDPLTGLKNRRFFAHSFHDECARSQRRKEHISLLFLDIDHFKRINDEYGHHIGDVVLKELGRYLQDQCRPYDTPVRWGGEEFLVMLRATDEAKALQFAERIRAGVARGISKDIPFPFTLSIGLAEHRLGDAMEVLVDRADQALYHAKQAGRNRVVSWSMLEKNLQGNHPDKGFAAEQMNTPLH